MTRISEHLLAGLVADTDTDRAALAPLEVEPTGRRIPHPSTCGACHGTGCPEIRLVGPAP